MPVREHGSTRTVTTAPGALLSPTVPPCLALSEHKMEVPQIKVPKRFFLAEYDGGGAPITLDQEKLFRFQINEPLLTNFYTNLPQKHKNTKVHT